ncbi:MAG TPA: hypothetical protein VFU98_16485 [Microlunatus sp.]|nr:hypothetical protein [Microlunatus sp.]
MSSTPPRMPAYGDRPTTATESMPLSRVIVRMVLVVLPSLLIGSFIGGILVSVLGVQVLRDTPALTLVMPATAGLLAGVGLGVVFAPSRTRVAAYALIALGITLVAYLLIFGLALLRASGPLPSASLAAYLTSPLVVLAAQSVVAVVIWLIKAGRRA